MSEMQGADVVRSTWAEVDRIRDVAADLFYGKLFEIAPQVRDLFPDDMREQKKKLMAMIGTAVGALDRQDILVPKLKALGADHAKYGAQDAHYEAVKTALMWTLGQGLQAKFTPAAEKAWSETYDVIAACMKQGADDAKT